MSLNMVQTEEAMLAGRDRSTDERISAAVRLFASIHGMNQSQVALAIGMTVPTMSNRMTCANSWQAREVEALADYFDRPVSDLYLPVEELVRSRCAYQKAQFTVHDGGDDGTDDGGARPVLSLVS
jgi:hypothetical protein